MLVRQVVDRKLAQYAYLIGCPRTGEAIVIDPERDVDRYFALAADHRLRIVAAADTHIHADYLSGLREMAERGVMVYASREGGPDWQYEWLRGSPYRYRLLAGGDTFTVGNVELRAVHTPGHTPEHLSYLVRDGGVTASDSVALVSGDFVFVGDVGRPDLLETAAGAIGSMEPAARELYGSIEREFKALPEHLQIWPGHGAGSACGKSLGDVPSSTVGYELRTNQSIRAASSEPAFVEYILAGQPEPPSYFARMKRENRIGPKVLRFLPRPTWMGANEVAGLAQRRNVAIVDTRPRDAFLAGHLPGAILADLDFQFCSIAGSYVNPDVPLYLVVAEDRVEEAVRALVRIGLDRVAGYLTPEALEAYACAGGRLAETETIDMAGLEARRAAGRGLVLDVRGKAEYDLGHVPGAINIAHTRLATRLGELPKDRPLLVHCATGHRSAAAAALLERHGFRVIDVNDTFANYRRVEQTASVTR